MNTKELENCLWLLGYWINEDQASIDKMLNEETRIDQDFVEPFSKELNRNLLSKDTFEAKRDLLKYYIFEFFELQGCYKEYNDILFTGSRCNYDRLRYDFTNEEGTTRRLTEFENYVVNSQQVFDILFTEIQLCCVKYKIDFFNACNDLHFSTEYFDSGITLAFEGKQNDDLTPQQDETKIEKATPFFQNNFDNIEQGVIYNHFKAGLVEKGYLTEQDLIEYLKAAFEFKAKPERLFKLKQIPSMQKIYTVFYVYYKDVSGKIHKRQRDYAALLGEYFEGYDTEIIQTNWSREYKVKR